MNPLPRLLHGILILDGGMATHLQKKGLAPFTSSDLWNITHPQEIIKTHGEFIDAGSGVILTNTFGSSPLRLKERASTLSTEEMNTLALKLAQQAIPQEKNISIVASIGPMGTQKRPLESLDSREVISLYAAQIRFWKDKPIAAMVFETQTQGREIELILEAIKELRGIPPFGISMSLNTQGLLYCGTPPRNLISIIEKSGASFVGVNCCGMEVATQALKEIQNQTKLSLWAKPNALDGESFVDGCLRLKEIGVNLIGGCCGIEPQHIQTLARALHLSPWLTHLHSPE